MAYDDLSAVQREAFVSAKADMATLHTLELRHSTFSGGPIRVVRDTQVLNATLEADAPENANQSVAFQPSWFNITLPELGGDPDPFLTVSIDNATGLITPYLELAAQSTEALKVTYRTFLWDLTADALELITPSSTPIYMEAFSATATETNVSLQITFVPIATKAFPGNKYNTEEFPGLAVS